MKNFLLILILCFAILSGVAYYLHQSNPAFDIITLLLANGILAVLTFLSFNLIYKAILKGGEGTYRAKISSTMMKFFVIIGAVLLYIVSYGKEHAHKPTIYFFLTAYIVYMIVETAILSNIARTHKSSK